MPDTNLVNLERGSNLEQGTDELATGRPTAIFGSELKETGPDCGPTPGGFSTAGASRQNFAPPTWQVEVYFDGDCPLCKREIDWLRKRDRNQRVKFTDIAAPEFDAVGLRKTQGELMARIHGRLPDGAWIEGVEVFRRLYSAVGLGWVVAPTRLPLIRGLLELAYRIFARYRLRLTGRCQAEKCVAGRGSR